jgi:tetratricopeptide (TPR) repeat protein
LTRRGRARQQAGQWEQAIAAYAAAIEFAPQSSVDRNNLAWLLATCPEVQFRNPKRAVVLATRAVELAPRDASSWNTLGVAQYRAADWTAAVESLTKSEESAPDQFTSFNAFFLAMAHSQLGDMEAARRCYDQAVAWMEQHKPADQELRRFCAEAAELLGPRAEQDE